MLFRKRQVISNEIIECLKLVSCKLGGGAEHVGYSHG